MKILSQIRKGWSLQRLLKMHPASLVVLSFIAVIILGTSLLMLPVATYSGRITFIDALFTATSAVCVTGLIVVDTGTYFTIFGQCVILALIQVGGLGIMTVSVVLFRAIGRSISFRQRMAMQEVFAHTPREDILQVVKTIITFTVIVETVGVGLFFVHWCREYPPDEAIYIAVFHSVSAFCNAGFSLFADSMIRYSDDLLLNINMCTLIIVGGIGFPVMYDIYIKVKLRKTKRSKLAVQTKTVLVTTMALIIVGAVMFWLLEERHTLSGRSSTETVLVSLFQSVTCRTAGFNTVDIAALNDSTSMVMICLMFFGASPGSCGGGVKTTTLALVAAFTWSRVRRKKRVNMFKKSIPPETVSRSISLILVSIALIGATLFLILAGNSVVDQHIIDFENRFLVHLFETVSAFGTVGLSMGVTAGLSLWGKSWIVLLMLVGRVGVLTFAYIIIGGGTVNGVEYSEENIMIG